MTVPVISVVGYSNSGKTRVAAALVATLSGWGYRVAAVKHCHQGHDMGRPFSDTSRLQKAGAAIVVASSPGRTTTVEETNSDLSLEELVERVRSDVDIVVAEGFKTSSAPKVLIVGETAEYPVIDNVVAVVSDENTSVEAPAFRFHEVDLLAARIRRAYLQMRKAGPAHFPAAKGLTGSALGRRA